MYNIIVSLSIANTVLLLAECDEGIRLVNSSGLPANNSGLVEICLAGRWNRVCDRHWDRNEAAVVCDELGLPSSGFISCY